MSDSNTKPTNPKDAIGIAKVPMSTVPGQVMLEVGLGLMEGALKYGRHNYREVGVRASVYYDATMRHLMDWWEGTDIDPDSGLSHVTKAIASLVVLRDAMLNAKLTDDRPPGNPLAMAEMNAAAKRLLEKYTNPVPAHVRAQGVGGEGMTFYGGRPGCFDGTILATKNGSIEDE